MLHTEGGRCCRSDGARFALDRSNEGPAIFGPLDLIRKAAGRGCERADGSELTVRRHTIQVRITTLDGLVSCRAYLPR